VGLSREEERKRGENERQDRIRRKGGMEDLASDVYDQTRES